MVDLIEEWGLRGQLKPEGGQPELSLAPAQGGLAQAPYLTFQCRGEKKGADSHGT